MKLKINHALWRLLSLATLSLTGISSLAVTPVEAQGSWSWNRVAVGGGGWMTGIMFHPKDASVLYARCDVAGIFRWHGNQWVNLSDNLPTEAQFLRGCEGFATDPNESSAQTIYAVFGHYQDHHNYQMTAADAARQGLYKSTDRGQTWTQILAKRSGSNETFRFDGENVAVDPKASQVVYYGTRRDGLWISTNATSAPSDITFSQAPTSQIPVGHTSGDWHAGIRTIVFDLRSGSENTVRVGGVNRTKHVYLSLPKVGVYGSADGGLTWAKLEVPGMPTGDIHRMVVLGDGALVAAHDAGLSKYVGGAWTSITPAGVQANVQSVALNPDNLDEMIVGGDNGGEYSYATYRTTNARSVTSSSGWIASAFESGTAIRNTPAPWNSWTALISPVLAWKPGTSQVWEADVYGVWMTPDIKAAPVAWTSKIENLEITVNETLHSPASGAAKLFAGFGDVRGFRWTELNAYQSAWMTQKGGTAVLSVDSSNGDGSSVVRYAAGSAWEHFDSPQYWFSTNNGVDWSQGAVPLIPGVGNLGKAQLAVSSDAAQRNRVVMLTDSYDKPAEGLPYYTQNGFNTDTKWVKSEGSLPVGGTGHHGSKLLQADKKNGAKFFIASAPEWNPAKVYVSSDYGQTWSVPATQAEPGLGFDALGTRAYPWKAQFDASPVSEGEVWLGMGSNGLFCSTDSAARFKKIANVSQVRAMTLGLPQVNGQRCAVYVLGEVTDSNNNKSWGVFFSLDSGDSWTKINDGSMNFPGIGNEVFMEADGQVFGRIYIGDGATGVTYGSAPSVIGDRRTAPTNKP